MSRFVRSTRGRQLGIAAACVATLLGAATAPAHAEDPYRSNDLNKPIVIVAGPEVSAKCASTAALTEAVAFNSAKVDGKPVRFNGRWKRIFINPKDAVCTHSDVTRIDAASLEAAAVALSKELETASADKGIDVIALGTGGPVLRYALLMSARKRAGIRSFSEVLFANRIDVEDAVTLGSVLDGAPIAPASCGGGGLCDDLVRPPAHVQKPLHWQLMDSAEQDGGNPQGVRGTDWSVIGLAGDRFAGTDSATGMDAAHKTIYEDDKLTFQKALVDARGEKPQKIRFLHAPETEWASTTRGPHVLPRIVDDIIYGVSPEKGTGDGAAFEPGCTGFNDGGSTVVFEPKMASWDGDKKALRTVKAGTIEAFADCFKTEKKDIYTVSGGIDTAKPVRINGLDFVLKDHLAELEINTKLRTVKRKSGTVRVEIPVGENRRLPLWTFSADSLGPELALKFPGSGDGAIQSDDGDVFSLASPELEIKGFKVSGAISLKVIKGGLDLDLSLALPGIFSNKLAPSGTPECGNGRDDDKDGETDAADEECDGGTTGDHEDQSAASAMGGTISTTNEFGMRLDKFNFAIGGTLRFGPFRTQGSIGVSYDRRDDLVNFDLEASLPAMAGVGMKLKVGLKEGALASIYGELNGLSIPLWSSGWYAQKIGLGLSGLTEGQQLEILISTGVSFLRKIAGEYFIYLEGDLKVGWGAPWKFGLSGSLAIMGDRYGSASLEYEQNVGGKLGLTLGREIPIGKDAQFIPQGTISGSMGISGELDIGASIQACFKGDFGFKEYEDPMCAGKADMRLTRYIGQPISQAVCFRTSLKVGGEFSVGFVTTYDTDSANGFKSDIDFIWNSCDVGDYGAKKAQASATTDGFTILPGTKSRVVTITGQDGTSPNVVLVAPDGTRIATPDVMGAQVAPNAYVLTGVGGQTAFALGEPQPGRWKVEPQPGSVAVAKIDQLEVLPEPVVSAKVRRERHGFALAYDVQEQPGQTVRFIERRDGLIGEIGTTTGGTGTRPFDPAFGPSGKREIVAIVEQNGRVRRELVVGSYVAPAAAKPGKVKTVTVTRKGRTIAVRWSKAQRATGGYEVVVRLPGGRTQAQITKQRKLVLRDVAIDGKTEVRIRALRKQDEAGGPLKVVKRRV